MEITMNIPEKFKLFGKEWTVVFDNDKLDNDKAYGQSNYTSQEIYMASKAHGVERAQTGIEQTFMHELTHAILDSMHEHDLSNNEKFVQTFSGLLHQALTTAE